MQHGAVRAQQGDWNNSAIWKQHVQKGQHKRARGHPPPSLPSALALADSGVKSVLPHLSGFSDFCINLQGVSLAAFQLRVSKSLPYLGPAP